MSINDKIIKCHGRIFGSVTRLQGKLADPNPNSWWGILQPPLLFLRKSFKGKGFSQMFENMFEKEMML